MPISVAELFSEAKLDVKDGVHGVGWNATKAQVRIELAAIPLVADRVRRGEPSDKVAGVYAVCLSNDPSRNDGLLREAPLSVEKIGRWIAAVPKFQLNGLGQPEPEAVCRRLKSFWLPEESILYIGQTDLLCKRLSDLFGHSLGRRSPHRGGHWLHTLSNLDQLRVYVAACSCKDEAERKEKDLLRVFMGHISAGNSRPHPLGNTLPFANLAGPQVERKQHGLRYQTRR